VLRQNLLRQSLRGTLYQNNENWYTFSQSSWLQPEAGQPLAEIRLWRRLLILSFSHVALKWTVRDVILLDHMHADRWQELKEKMRSQKMVIEEEVIHHDEKTTELMVVQTTLGKLKFEFTEKPRFLGTKTQFSNRIGSTVDVIPEYSKSDTVTILDVFRWNDAGNRWDRLDPAAIPL